MWSKDAWYDFNFLKFTEICFVAKLNLSWRMLHIHLRRMCILLLSDGTFYSSVSCSVMSTLCDPMNCSPPDSSIHGIFQARTLECVAILFSRGPSWPKDRTLAFCIAGIALHSLPSELQATSSVTSRACLPLLILYLDSLSINVSVVLKFPTIVLLFLFYCLYHLSYILRLPLFWVYTYL